MLFPATSSFAFHHVDMTGDTKCRKCGGLEQLGNSDSSGARRFFCLIWSGKQRTISPIFRLPNYTKFGNKTSIDVAMQTFETEF